MSSPSGTATAATTPARVLVTGRRLAGSVGPPMLFGLLFLLAWEGVVAVFDLKPFFLPAPSAIGEAFIDSFGNVRSATLVSGTNALIGLLAGTVVGIASSFLLMRYSILNDLATPLAIALNAIPIIVLVSVFNNMFSITSEVPRRLMVTLVVYFIVLVNVAKGLRQVSPTHLELLRSLAAGPRQVLVKARIPNALPHLFTALKIAAPTSVITAFVSEYFGGSQNGLGSRITSNVANSNNAVAWAYVLGACLLGLTFYLVSVALEAITTHRRGSDPEGTMT